MAVTLKQILPQRLTFVYLGAIGSWQLLILQGYIS